MIVTSVRTTIDIDMDDVIDEMDGSDKRALLRDLLSEGSLDEADVAEAFDEASLEGDVLVNELLDRGVIDNTPKTLADITLFGINYDSCNDDLDFVSKVLCSMPMYDLRKALCNALMVGTYMDDAMLREKLESVITAK